MKILQVDSSAMTVGSHSRALTDRVVVSFGDDVEVTRRDLAQGVPFVDQQWVIANYTPDADRGPEQRAALALSDALVAEVFAADVIVIGLPIYNFGLPAALKAWVDQVCRARKTFLFTESGPVGLVHGKKAIVVYVSAGTPMGSPVDHASGHMRLLLNFIGITDVSFIAAGMHLTDPGCLDTAGELADRIGRRLSPGVALAG